MAKSYKERKTKVEFVVIPDRTPVSMIMNLLQEIISIDEHASFSVSESDYYSSSSIQITYYRPETDVEYDNRISDEKANRKITKNQRERLREQEREDDLVEFERLKKKLGKTHS